MFRVKIDFPQSGSRYVPSTRVVSISDISRAISIEKSFENSSARVQLQAGWLEGILNSEEQYLKGRTLEIYDGEDLIFTGKITEIPSVGFLTGEIVADALTYGLDQPVNRRITRDEFPNCPTANLGKFGNRVYGSATGENFDNQGILIARRIASGKYLAAWHWLKQLTAVYTTGGDEITINCTLENSGSDPEQNAYINYDSDDLEIYFCCLGRKRPNNELVTNPARILNQLVVNAGGWDELDGLTEAISIYDARNYSGEAVCIVDSIAWKEFLRKFSRSFDCFVFQKASGVFGIKVLDWGTEAPTVKIHPQYIDQAHYQAWPDITKIYDQVQRYFCLDFRKGEFQQTPLDIEAETEWEATIGKIEMPYQTDSVTASDVASRYIFFHKVPVYRHSFQVPNVIGRQIDIANVVQILSKKIFFQNEDRLVLILRKRNLPSGMVQFDGIDVTAINYNLIRLWEDDDPDIVLLKNEADENCHVLI